MKKVFLLLLPLVGVLATAAQMTERIETDRPDQTESPYLVPLHYFQGEFGFNLVDQKNELRQVVHPTALLKYGLTNRFELRLVASPYTEIDRTKAPKQKEFLLEPVEIGTKVRLFEEKGLRPKTSLITHLGLPFAGSPAFRSTPITYSATLTLQNSLSESVALGYNVGVERDVAEKTAFFYTVAPGFNIGERWYAYIEAFGSFSGGEQEHNLDGGIAYHPSANTKIDLSSGFGLSSSDLKHYVAIGFSFRLPLR